MTAEEIYPWGRFEIDPNTGLPEVPEGFFFRVAKTGFGYWQVQLRRRRRGWFSKNEESATHVNERPINRRWILDGAAYVITKYRERDPRKSDATLLGDYPPKKLTDDKEN